MVQYLPPIHPRLVMPSRPAGGCSFGIRGAGDRWDKRCWSRCTPSRWRRHGSCEETTGSQSVGDDRLQGPPPACGHGCQQRKHFGTCASRKELFRWVFVGRAIWSDSLISPTMENDDDRSCIRGFRSCCGWKHEFFGFSFCSTGVTVVIIKLTKKLHNKHRLPFG